MSQPSRPSGRWSPLLQGEAAEQALAVALEIAAALTSLSSGSMSSFSLGGGAAGVALFFAYLDRAFPGSGHDEQAGAFLEQAGQEMSRAHSRPALFGGFPGVAWLVEHLQEDEEEDGGDEIAAALERYLGRDLPVGDFDLVGGLVGLGVYALERGTRSGGEECLRRVVAHLAREAESRPEGLAWYTPPEQLVAATRAHFPRGNFNLGVAHGTPGVIGFLGEACAVSSVSAEAGRLLGGAVPWLLRQRLPPDAGSAFSYALSPTSAPKPARLAWCYGDLGIATALLGAARRAGERGWEREALALARAAAARPVETSGVEDPGLCHGAAGNAHLFNRLYRATGDSTLEAAARFWLARALEMRRPGEGTAGFLAYVPDEQGEMAWRPEPGFLNGAAGIGLALLAAATSIEPAWDRLLLASLPAAS